MVRVDLMPFIFFLLTVSVVPVSSLSQTVSSENFRTNPAATRTYLANLLLEKTSEGYHATLKNARMIDGDHKPGKNATLPWSEGDLIALLPGSNTRNSDTFYLGKPFQTRYEYPGDNGAIGSVTRNSENAALLLRIPYQGQVKAMRLELFGADRRFTPIADLPLEPSQQ